MSHTIRAGCRRRAHAGAAAALSLIVAACGGAPSSSAAPASSSSAASSQPATSAVTTLDAVRGAVVQIVAEGAFVDPTEGATQGAGSGSGFVIDPSGIAVTNNHVVTGAAFLEVFVDGEDEPRNAEVLGVSECSDLAVIDIEGAELPFLAWYEGEINPGLDVYAAGFPLGDPEYTLTRGIVSKAEANGETQWASVDSVIEHDASIQPGNSGGPLVDADGRVVGVNYAVAEGMTDVQFRAIARDEALPVIETLREGEDLTSIGINGEVMQTDDGSSGIWVASVESGSPAEQAGVEGGDLITKLEGLAMGADGTMSDYCDILRTNDATEPLAIEVVRFDTGETLGGVLNQTPLETVSRPEPTDDGGGGTGYAGYEEVRDDAGAISVVVPIEWSDRSGLAWQIDGTEVGVSVAAAPDLQAWYDGWDQPGVFFGASASLAGQRTVGNLLDENSFADTCEYAGRFEYEDALYAGQYDEYLDCAGLGTTFYVISAEPPDGSFIMFLQISLVGPADDDALEGILNSFQVVDTLP